MLQMLLDRATGMDGLEQILLSVTANQNPQSVYTDRWDSNRSAANLVP
jgi:hypothetical protein